MTEPAGVALDLVALTDFIVRAKAATYVGGGAPAPSSGPDSHDLEFEDGRFVYRDSYVGGSDFLGHELVTREGRPVWVMNYYGYLLRPNVIDAAQAGQVIKTALSALYAEGRFLGGFICPVDGDVYTDTSDGDVTHFVGTEWITRRGERLYELVYHGGLVRA